MNSKVTFLIVTYNRCPYKKFEDNPLIQSIITLMNNFHVTQILEEILIVVDGSSDHTLAAIKQLQEKAFIKIRIIINNRRTGCSASRRKGIKLIKTKLFFMGDDDCLYSKYFLAQNINAFQNAYSLDQNVAVLIPPILEGDILLKKSIENKFIGYTDFKNAWFDFNFDCIPKRKNKKKLLKVSIFKGVSLNKTTSFLEAGNFEVLTEWKSDYSEHLEIAHRLEQIGMSFYYHYEPRASCFHLKFGRLQKNKKNYQNSYWPGLNEPLSKIIGRSNSFNKKTGCATDEIKFVEDKIGSFFAFFLKITPEAAIFHLNREWEKFVCKNTYLSGNNQMLSKPKRIRLFKKAVKKGLQFLETQNGHAQPAYKKLINEFIRTKICK